MEPSNIYLKKLKTMTFSNFKRTMNLLACNASVAFSPAQANCLSLGDINSSQLVQNLGLVLEVVVVIVRVVADGSQSI